MRDHGPAMKTFVPILLLAASSVAVLIQAKEAAPAKTPPPSVAAPSPANPAEKRIIEVCFVLDTTGSMAGLIEGAKQKIWSIATAIVSAKPKPEVRMGIVGYRDRGDAYVTKKVDLTSDMDTFYARLQEFQAAGGGDTPESVSEALHEAVTKLSWTPDASVFRVMYLVGDAPPQHYQDGKDWQKVCKKAGNKDIVINTVQCGNIAGTAEVWKAIASNGNGVFAQIPQDGNMVSISAPQDAELQTLNAEVGATLIPCGPAAKRREVEMKQGASMSLSGASNASRLSYNSLTGVTVQGGGELLDQLAQGTTTLEKVKRDELPESLQGMTADELKTHVEKQAARRKEIQARIAQLTQERAAWLRAETQKLAAAGKSDSFDDQVTLTIRDQAARKGFKFD